MGMQQHLKNDTFTWSQSVRPLVIFLLFPFIFVLQHPFYSSIVMNTDLCSNYQLLAHKYRNMTSCIINNTFAFNGFINYITIFVVGVFCSLYVVQVYEDSYCIYDTSNTATVFAPAQSTSSLSPRIYLVAQVCKYETQRH